MASSPALRFLGDLGALRKKLERAETAPGELWGIVRRLARNSPENYPWLCPFAAVVTGEKDMVENARNAIRRYVKSFPELQLGMGVQFHFWCFSFPHARWMLYFMWLDELYGWEKEERRQLLDAFVEFQFVNFFYGMRTKPEPECEDNQTLSLCFSNALCGYLFGEDPDVGALARRMGEDGLRRLPALLTNLPPSGYSGEGSTYMDYVVGPATTLSLELLRLATGRDYFKEAEPVLRMLRREWMPGLLLLPYDHYGYSYPSRSSIAYLAGRTNSGYCHELLNRAAALNIDHKLAWGFDDWVWTMVWQPDGAPGSGFEDWVAPDLGGAVVGSGTDELYLMQMWDPASAVPIRAQVNPNSLVLEAAGSPLLVDGVGTKECTRFQFDGAWVDRTGQNFGVIRSHFGEGCAGSHSVLLVDNWEAMRPDAGELGGTLIDFDAAAKTIAGDVTELYRRRWADTKKVARRSRLCFDRFWLIEDCASFGEPHTVAARWMLRPEQIPARRGVAIRTAEGVRLHLIPVLGPDAVRTEIVQGYPNRLEGYSLLADFEQHGADCRWLWLAFPVNEHAFVVDCSSDWAVATTRGGLNSDAVRLPFTRPAFMLGDMPVVSQWYYRKSISVPDGGEYVLQLPRGMINPSVRLNGKELDLRARIGSAKLLPLFVDIPSGKIEIEVGVEVPLEAEGDLGFRFGGPVRLLWKNALPEPEATLEQGVLHVKLGDESWTMPWEVTL